MGQNKKNRLTLFLKETILHSFPSSLRKLREGAGLTQNGLAKELGIPRSTIAGYERGNKEPRMERLLELAKYFHTSTDFLLNGKSIKSEKILAITVDNQNNENIEFVPIKAAAGYLKGYESEVYITSLKKFNLPNLPIGTYRAFEIEGDSMPPLESGTIVIGRFVSEQDVKDGQKYIVVDKEEGIVFKRIYKSPDSLLAISDNPMYEPFKIRKDNIIEMWEFYSFIAFRYKHIDEYQAISDQLKVIENKLNRLL